MAYRIAMKLMTSMRNSCDKIEGFLKMLPLNKASVRGKCYPAFERPTLSGSVLRSIIIENIHKAYSSTDDNIEKRLLQDEPTFAIISTARKLAKQLDMNGIDYAIVGGFALNVHGFKRQTLDVDVLLTKENLNKFNAKVLYNGFAPRFRGARRSFRDPVSNVGVDVIVAGEFPGDGKEKSISFPDPSTTNVNIDGVKVINLHTLIDLKLASYMSMPQQRMKDRTDVSGLVKILSMDESYAVNLHKDVVDEFLRIVEEVKSEMDNLE
ncbi:hypothetical protein HA402_005511 [Bradysia odoriphaga]|nr:hypothetical protein HA402_005511 [Bradysia odoriphaga]